MDKLKPPFLSDIQRVIKEWKDPSLEFIEAHTSGSTGKPKLIRLPKELLRRSAERSVNHFGIDSRTRLHLALSPAYIAGKMMIIRALEAQCKLTWEEPSASPLESGETTDPIQLLAIVGAQLPGLIENHRRGKLPEIRHLLIGGAPLTSTMREMAVEGPWDAWESYGMTETASHIALRRITPGEILPFETLSGISVSCDNDDCLIIDMGPDGIFHTNDIAQLIDSGKFFILGRKDNVIITGGHKVFPEQLESILARKLPEGLRFYVTSRPSEKWGEEIVLVIEGTPMELPDFHTMSLESFQIPRHVVFMPKLKTTSTGKIIRHLPDEN